LPSIRVKGILGFEAVECESRIATQSKMKHYHVQEFLVGERLFVGWDVTNFDVLKFVSHGDAQKRNANIISNAKEVFPCLVGGEGSQLMVIVTNHGFSDH
jgi:hypothetical protein